MKVVRKAGNEDTLFLYPQIIDVLKDYIENERPLLLKGKNDPALFISLRGKRLIVRSVQAMVEKYGKNAELDNRLTPHKLRRTYGTSLYNSTGDNEDLYKTYQNNNRSLTQILAFMAGEEYDEW